MKASNGEIFHQFDQNLKKKDELFSQKSLLTLHQAAREGQVKLVEQYLKLYWKDKKKLNEKDEEETTALHYAVRYGHFDIVKTLVAYGANVNIPGENGATPLHYASRYTERKNEEVNIEIKQQMTTYQKFSLHKGLKHFDIFFGDKTKNLAKKQSKEIVRKKKVSLDSSHKGSSTMYTNQVTDNTNSIKSKSPYNKRNNIFSKPKTSFLYHYEHNQNEDKKKSAVVIVGTLNQEEIAEMKTIDALILPTVKNVTSLSKINLSKNNSAGSISATTNLSDHFKEKFNKKNKKLFKWKKSNDSKQKDSILMFLLEQKVNVNAKDINGSTPLHYAATRGNLFATDLLLKQKNIHIEAVDQSKMTPLHCASVAGSFEVCEMLLKHEASILCQDKENMTPLHWAAMEGHLDIVQLFFNHAENQGGYCLVAKLFLASNRNEQTALHLAVENNHIDIVKLCIDKGSNVNLVQATMNSPLHLACTSGLLEIAKLLVESGANIESKNSLQETPLHKATLFNHIEIIEFLLVRGVHVDCRDKDNETPLLIAVRKNYFESVKLLLEYTANIYAKDSNDKTCLFLAAEENSKEALEILCKYDIKNLLEEINKYGMTPLHIAAKEGHDNIVQTLLSLGACIDAKCHESLTPLHLAAKNGHFRIVQLLLSNVLSIANDVDDSSNTPLHLAAMEGHVKIVEMLIEVGSAVHTRNANQMTPLDCASYRGWNQCAQFLLDADSIINPSDKVKITSLHLASKEGHVDIVKLLLSKNADVTRKDHLGKNCLDYAIENNHREVAMAIIGCNNWKNALRNSTVEGNKLTTPMRKLIKKFPDVAEQVFNQCISDNGLPPKDPQFKITCSYEFLEDTFAPWCTISSDSNKQQYPSKLLENSYRTPFFSTFSSIRTRFSVNWMRKNDFKQNHPLKFMVQNEHTDLLCHPLVTYLLRCKWSCCGRYAYYSRLFLYMIFLLFINGYALTLRSNLYQLNANETVLYCQPIHAVSVSSSVKFFVNPARYLVIILCSLSLGIEFVKLLTDPYHYIHIHRVVELAAYICSLIYATQFKPFDSDVSSFRCSYLQRQLGGAIVTLSWLGFVLLMRRFPKLGIYVVMFLHILKTFTQIFPIWVLFIIAFGLGFHLIMFVELSSFSTPARSFVMLLTAMGGEFDFDTIFNPDPPFYTLAIAWPMYAIFLVIDCLVLMSLLIALAAADIKSLRKQAVLKRLTMLVDLTLDVEKALPISLQKKLVKMEESVYPNVHKSWNLWSFWSFESPSTNIRKKNKIKNIQKEQCDLRENIRKLRRRMKAIEAQNNRVEDLLNGVINRLNYNKLY
ncbi:transient receptor potential cation channel subfamily A member 1 homolog isoform X5 [Hydra vulgaris]|uniref:Transient receptor potential cation channel subfamily A member 1 homolog isoform X5 n=1 Tax=Hydra vulgaris TaxID=6087 RepID=A0ABM4BJL1_HYDVU